MPYAQATARPTLPSSLTSELERGDLIVVAGKARTYRRKTPSMLRAGTMRAQRLKVGWRGITLVRVEPVLRPLHVQGLHGDAKIQRLLDQVDRAAEL